MKIPRHRVQQLRGDKRGRLGWGYQCGVLEYWNVRWDGTKGQVTTRFIRIVDRDATAPPPLPPPAKRVRIPAVRIMPKTVHRWTPESNWMETASIRCEG